VQQRNLCAIKPRLANVCSCACAAVSKEAAALVLPKRIACR